MTTVCTNSVLYLKSTHFLVTLQCIQYCIYVYAVLLYSTYCAQALNQYSTAIFQYLYQVWNFSSCGWYVSEGNGISMESYTVHDDCTSTLCTVSLLDRKFMKISLSVGSREICVNESPTHHERHYYRENDHKSVSYSYQYK